MIHTLILAGGVGNRLFPLSTPERPKQFIDVLGSGETLLQSTFKRLEETFKEGNVKHWAICPKRYFKFFKEQGVECNLIEERTEGRNTGPAIGYALRTILESNVYNFEDTIIIVPADAYIKETNLFKEDILKAVELAKSESDIICLGITPTYPSTKYGYIEFDESDITNFKEKPSREKAEEYIKSGRYLWNAGIFVSKLGVLRSAFIDLAPDIWFYLSDLDLCPKISIDYAIMEKALGKVIPVQWTWNDLGSFESIEHVKRTIWAQ